MRVFYSFMGRKSPLFLPSMVVLRKTVQLNFMKSKVGKSFKVCPEYDKDLKTGTSRDSVPEGVERVSVPWRVGRDRG